MQKSNCLIIDNFAGTRVYDEDILEIQQNQNNMQLIDEVSLNKIN